ncbi:formate dehydrogenase accessory sulfurtransferase FdhD [Megalodesulfovibrio paquesii]
MEGAPFQTVPCLRFLAGETCEMADTVAQEVAISLRLDDGPPRRLFASPRALEVLALGHAALELAAPGQIPELAELPEVAERQGALAQAFALRSRPDSRPAADPALPHGRSAADLLALMRRFIAAPGLWDSTGCFHRAALLDTTTDEFVARAEDIGRHNCVDRLAGYCVLNGLRPANLMLFLSCRVTASMMDKAARLGARVIVSRSAVTDAAIALALHTGTTLVGFARDAEERLTIFADSAGRVRQ